MKKTALILLALLAASCHSDNFLRREDPGLRGWSETRLVEKFGVPVSVHTNTVAEFAHSPEPWRPPIPQALAMYSTNVPTNLNVQIKDFSWQRGRIMLTAWLRPQQDHWITLYAEEWNMDEVE